MKRKNLLVRLFTVAALINLAACQNVTDDLVPSDEDNRPQVEEGTVGHLPGQVTEDFTLADSHGASVRLADQLQGGATPADAVVLYFTMWCPICLSHSDHLVGTVTPHFATRGTVRYYLIDYVSGSVAGARAAELANGYDGSALVTVADVDQAVFDQFDAAMGTVVVIDATGTIHVNEDYRDGTALRSALDAILPP